MIYQKLLVGIMFFSSISLCSCSAKSKPDDDTKNNTPRLTLILPNTGYRGESVSVVGVNLPASGVNVMFGTEEAEIVAANNNQYEVLVPFVENAGELQVVVAINGENTNSLKFIVRDQRQSILDGPAYLSVREEGISRSYTVKATGQWEIVRKSGGVWAEATPAFGHNEGSFNITVARNQGTSLRSAQFSLMLNGREAETISITQEAAKLDKAYMYCYGPYNTVGAKIFGTIVCNFEKDDPGRNSHGGPAALQYPNGDLVAFYTNASGHNTDGWSEYSVSKDGGNTWSMYNKLDYSYNAYQTDRSRPAWVERGLVTVEGTIVLFISELRNTGSGGDGRVGSGFMRSRDNGQTWSEYKPLDGAFVGYPVATAVVGSTNYILYNSSGPHVLYVSNDDGLTWNRRSTLLSGVWYGTMCFMEDGRLIAGAYRTTDENHFYYSISNDNGFTWGPQKTAYLDKKIRNPKIACLNGKYYLFGRSGEAGEYRWQFVVYQSDDGENWNPGVMVNVEPNPSDGYSDVCMIDKGDGPELMLLYSIAYRAQNNNPTGWVNWITNSYVFFVKPQSD